MPRPPPTSTRPGSVVGPDSTDRAGPGLADARTVRYN
ncbi:hypothetical protein Ae168Ps1_0315c [Pseudonocardia sp. Ae168_Ps1]|nr:hypothetical protein Ae150APs1_0320c [Pseudonocardia sp. Ae150A_Ps1]OLL77909.1 hypothetical protein Ae168Ps1_0315c [Pseudonocardia sp. Ae168_Ps1]OLL87968.1 hypothetical protein Ae263Ps1_5023 [Pseudonocardia sp. Ae263_Ps1]OLL92007.1 hypothetical protein Ae356Ps1_1904c [Pseudonocardia sp. Ae356_Ps1]